MKILITGGARSGKSRHALSLGRDLGRSRLYVATAEPLDDEMRQRIEAHRDERGTGWRTVEEPVAVASLLGKDEVVLLDCLTLWLTNLLMREEADQQIHEHFDELCAAIDAASNHIILVTNEVGLGIVPTTPLGRRFRDLAGFLSQRVAQSCTRVVLMCAGIPVEIK